MITTQLLRPESIVVVGASNNVHKPGGAILKNLINGGYQGELRAVNPKEKEVQGVPAFADVNDLPDTDLAVLAIPAVMCPDIVETLASKKQTRAFIILSAVLVKKPTKEHCWKSVFWKQSINTEPH